MNQTVIMTIANIDLIKGLELVHHEYQIGEDL